MSETQEESVQVIHANQGGKGPIKTKAAAGDGLGPGKAVFYFKKPTETVFLWAIQVKTFWTLFQLLLNIG